MKTVYEVCIFDYLDNGAADSLSPLGSPIVLQRKGKYLLQIHILFISILYSQVQQ